MNGGVQGHGLLRDIRARSLPAHSCTRAGTTRAQLGDGICRILLQLLHDISELDIDISRPHIPGLTCSSHRRPEASQRHFPRHTRDDAGITHPIAADMPGTAAIADVLAAIGFRACKSLVNTDRLSQRDDAHMRAVYCYYHSRVGESTGWTRTSGES